MEENKDMIGMNKIKAGKPPTRLQKQAPASLQIDQVKAAVCVGSNRTSTDLGPSSEAAMPIPLLTPLALSPGPFPEADDFMFPNDDKKSTTPAPTPTLFGWRQQAGSGGYVDPSMFALFQNKCVIVNDAQ